MGMTSEVEGAGRNRAAIMELPIEIERALTSIAPSVSDGKMTALRAAIAAVLTKPCRCWCGASFVTTDELIKHVGQAGHLRL